MVKRDARLLLALAAHRERHPSEGESCPTLAQVRATFSRDTTGSRVLAYLANPSGWLPTHPERGMVATWLLAHAPQLLQPQDANELAALLSAPQFPSDRDKGYLVLAVLALYPSRRGRLLSAWADRLTAPPLAFLTELAAFAPEHPRIAVWLRPDSLGRCADELRAQAVLAGLVQSRAGARKVMAAVLRDPEAQLAERPIFVALLAETALALGGPADLGSYARDLRSRRCAKLRQEQVEAAEGTIARALPRCLDVLAGWLR